MESRVEEERGMMELFSSKVWRAMEAEDEEAEAMVAEYEASLGCDEATQSIWLNDARLTVYSCPAGLELSSRQ